MTEIEDRLAELAARFAARLPDERAAIAEAVAAGDRDTLVDRAHKLAGIAGMFGFADIGAAALAVEEEALAGVCSGDAAMRLLALMDEHRSG